MDVRRAPRAAASNGSIITWYAARGWLCSKWLMLAAVLAASHVGCMAIFSALRQRGKLFIFPGNPYFNRQLWGLVFPSAINQDRGPWGLPQPARCFTEDHGRRGGEAQAHAFQHQQLTTLCGGAAAKGARGEPAWFSRSSSSIGIEPLVDGLKHGSFSPKYCKWHISGL